MSIFISLPTVETYDVLDVLEFVQDVDAEPVSLSVLGGSIQVVPHRQQGLQEILQGQTERSNTRSACISVRILKYHLKISLIYIKLTLLIFAVLVKKIAYCDITIWGYNNFISFFNALVELVYLLVISSHAVWSSRSCWSKNKYSYNVNSSNNVH